MRLIGEYITLYVLLTLYSIVQKDVDASESVSNKNKCCADIDLPEIVLN